MSADDIGCFLPAVAYNRSFDTSARDATVGLPCKGIYRYVSSFKLLFKPVAVLLEDQGSRASCAGYHQRSFMFIAKLDFLQQCVLSLLPGRTKSNQVVCAVRLRCIVAGRTAAILDVAILCAVEGAQCKTREVP